MTPFTRLTGIAAALPRANIDTDQIIPGRFLKTVTRSGLGAGLFVSLRHDEHGALRPDFVLNRPAWRGTRILIAGENFGCGSSREHAPWALLDYGIRCVIAPSFGDIFYDNSVNCGLLPAIVSLETVSALVEIAETTPTNLTVDLPAGTITGSVGDWRFQIGETPRDRLLSGLDQIGVTLAQMDAIRRYEQSRRA